MERYDIDVGDQEMNNQSSQNQSSQNQSSQHEDITPSAAQKEQPYRASSWAEETHNETYFLMKRFYGMYE